MNTRKHLTLGALGILMLISLACGFEMAKSNDLGEQAELQLTVEALKISQAASANQQNAVQQPQPASQNQPSQVQAEVQPSPTPTDDGIPCNSSKFVSETIPDFTVFQPGATFQKSWTLRNAGDCDWSENYVFVFEEGDRMDGESSIKVNTVIEPGETVTFTVNLKAPAAAGDYVGVWRLKAADGEKLGKYWVKIKVEEPQPEFAVTSVSTNLKNSYSGNCPIVIDLNISIKANGKGTVVFQPETSDLGLHPESTMKFDSAGTKSTGYTWTIQSSNSYWLKVHIKDPNNQTFGPYNVTVTCN